MSATEQLHPIKLASVKSGLSPHVIRVWERRYGAVAPERTGTQRRMYSERDIDRLKLLGRLTASGHSIGNIATLEVDALRAMLADSPAVPAGMPADRLKLDRRESGRPFVLRAIRTIVDLEQDPLELALQEGALALGQQGVLIHVIAPLAEEIGRLWQNGTIGVAHEHFASAILRTFLANMSRPFAVNETSPHILTATPTGQLHELGAMLITAAAVALGWQATYLGSSISPVEIVGALRQKPARVVGLSIVYPPDDPSVARELRRLRQLLPPEVTLMVGGRAAPGYQEVIREVGAVETGSLEDFMQEIQSLRETPAQAPR